MMTFGIVHCLVTAGQPLGGPRFKHKSDPLSGWAVDYVVDSLNQLLWRSGFGAKDIIRITSKFTESCEGLGVLGEVQDSDEEAGVVTLCGGKRFEAGYFLVEFSQVKTILWQIDAGKINLVEDGSHRGKHCTIAWDRGGQIDRLQFQRLINSPWWWHVVPLVPAVPP